MKQIKYIEADDTLRFIYADEIDQPIVRILTNGTILEFDYQHNLIAIDFPNFFLLEPNGTRNQFALHSRHVDSLESQDF